MSCCTVSGVAATRRSPARCSRPDTDLHGLLLSIRFSVVTCFTVWREVGSEPVGPSGSAAQPGSTPRGPVARTAASRASTIGKSAGIHGRPRTSAGLRRSSQRSSSWSSSGRGSPSSEFGEPHPHRRLLVERPARGGLRRQLGAEPHQHAQLFAELAVQGLFGCFAGLHLSARELPHSGKLRRRRPPRHEEPARFGQGVQYCAANDANESSHAHQSKAAAGRGRARRGGRAGKRDENPRAAG